MKTINKFKIALVAVGMLTIGTASAQTTTGDITQQGNATLNSTGTAVKLVDNKGTIKYIQAVNGLTSFTNTTPAGGIITTWQLGGTLTSNTYITASATGGAGGTPAEFALNGLELVANSGTNSSTNATTRSSNGTGTGFTVLIRDEASGAVQKMLLSELLQVQGSQHIYVPAEIVDTANPTTLALTALPGAPQNLVFGKVSVYRNGAKLLANVDYIVVNGATATDSASITLQPQATANEDWEVFAGDKIEVHWVK